jgi:hypothetical protein
MSRSIPAELLTALTQDAIEPFYAVELLFDGGAIRLWTGYGDKTIDGETYLGTSALLQISGLEEVADLSAKGASVTLSGISSSIMSLALQEPYQGRTARILFGARNVADFVQPTTTYAVNGLNPELVLDFGGEYYSSENNAIPEYTDFIEIFAGLIDEMPISDSGQSVTINVTIESKHITLQRSNVRRYTSANHKLRHPTDTFFDWVTQLADAEIVWGRTIA